VTVSAARACWTAVVLSVAVGNGARYYNGVIRSFADGETEKVFLRERSRRLPPDVQRRAHRKLLLIDAADAIADLRVPPGNRLERLSGDRAEQYSIRNNEKWRICFRWSRGDAHDVEIADDHRG
jgi:proteic killer suppression protein